MTLIMLQLHIALINTDYITGVLSLKAMLGFAARFHSVPPPLASVSDTVLPEASCRQKKHTEH